MILDNRFSGPLIFFHFQLVTDVVLSPSGPEVRAIIEDVMKRDAKTQLPRATEISKRRYEVQFQLPSKVIFAWWQGRGNLISGNPRGSMGLAGELRLTVRVPQFSRSGFNSKHPENES